MQGDTEVINGGDTSLIQRLYRVPWVLNIVKSLTLYTALYLVKVAEYLVNNVRRPPNFERNLSNLPANTTAEDETTPVSKLQDWQYVKLRFKMGDVDVHPAYAITWTLGKGIRPHPLQ